MRALADEQALALQPELAVARTGVGFEEMHIGESLAIWMPVQPVFVARFLRLRQPPRLAARSRDHEDNAFAF